MEVLQMLETLTVLKQCLKYKNWRGEEEIWQES